MKQKMFTRLTVIAIITLAFICMPMAWGQAEDEIKVLICPDGSQHNTNQLYDATVPRDFPEEFFPILCCTKMYTGLVQSHISYDCYVGVSSYSGTPYDDKGWTWVLVKEKYVAIIEYDRADNQHEIIWVSKTIPPKIKNYIEGVVGDINEQSKRADSF